jgi:hypothetical protein
LATSAKQIDSSGQAFVDQLIRWCCIDRLNWQGFWETTTLYSELAENPT